MTATRKLIFILAIASNASCMAQQVLLECKLGRWIQSSFSVFEPALLARNLQFGESFTVEIDSKQKTAIASYENYKLAEVTNERYVIVGDLDAFSFNRNTGQVAWALLHNDRGEGTAVALGSCEARQHKRKF